MCDYSNSSFLPYVLSDPNTVIGPQWTNHSASIQPVPDWKSTLYGNQSDLNEDKAGVIHMFSKTNAANSPGYILIDYDISFKELSVNPRAGTLPIARGQSQFVCFNTNGASTAGSNAGWNITTGKTVANTTSAAPTGAALGDIYKCVLQVTASQQVNAAWTGTTTPTVFNMLQYDQSNKAITLDDGFTVYASWHDTTIWYFYATIEEAVVGSSPLEWQTSNAAQVINLCAEMYLVRNINDLTQSSY